MIIYGLCDSGEPGVIRYVGKAIDPKRRLWEHLHGAIGETHKENWIRSVMSAGRKIEQVFIAYAATNEAANYLERHYIQMFRALGIDLTNTADGGDGQSPGWQPPEAWRRKKSQAMTGRVVSQETRNKLAQNATGVKFTEERKANISKAKQGQGRGIPKSAEHREKISAANVGKVKPYVAERNKKPWTPERRAAQSAAQQKRWAKKRSEELTFFPEPDGVM